MARKNVFKVVFHNQGKIYELYARGVQASSLFGFIEVDRLLFGQKSSVVVDPTEEQLKLEFGDVSRIHIPLHAVVRIDEVQREGAGKVTSVPGGDNVRPFPLLTRPED